MREFEQIVRGISGTDKIEHLFIVDIEFDHKNARKDKYFFMKFIHQFLKKESFACQSKISVPTS